MPPSIKTATVGTWPLKGRAKKEAPATEATNTNRPYRPAVTTILQECSKPSHDPKPYESLAAVHCGQWQTLVSLLHQADVPSPK